MVSVIIPNYNHCTFLTQRIESVLNQTFVDFEVIILDDCSSDDSRMIIEKYRGHPKVSVINYSERNSGSPFSQWEKGVALAKHKYIWIAESDDFASVEFLSETVKRMAEGFDLVYTRSHVVDEYGEIQTDYYWADSLDSRRWKTNHVGKGNAEINEYLIYRNTVSNVSACVFRKDRFQLPGEIKTMRYCGDWLFWITFLKNSRFSFIASPLNYHRRHSQTTRGLKDVKSEIARLREYWEVIYYARSTVNRGRVRISELPAYNWIFEEIYQKRRTIGFRGIVRGLPSLLYPWYLLFYLKKSAHRLVKY